MFEKHHQHRSKNTCADTDTLITMFFVVCVLYFGVFLVVWFVTKVFHRGPYVPRVALEPKRARTSISKETFSYFLLSRRPGLTAPPPPPLSSLDLRIQHVPQNSLSFSNPSPSSNHLFSTHKMKSIWYLPKKVDFLCFILLKGYMQCLAH